MQAGFALTVQRIINAGQGKYCSALYPQLVRTLTGVKAGPLPHALSPCRAHTQTGTQAEFQAKTDACAIL